MLALSACGGSSTGSSVDSSGSTTLADNEVLTDTYKVSYQASNMATVGKTSYTVTVTDRTTGAAISGAEVSFSPWMKMAMSEHGSPAGSVTDNGDGAYTGDVYYLMASSMNGQAMGDWTFGATINGETATWAQEVMMSMGDTMVVNFKNNADMITDMNGDAGTRTYFAFRQSLIGSNGAHTFTMFLATRQSMMMHPAVHTGATLKDENGTGWTVDNVTVEVSTDLSTWTSMTESGAGVFSVAGLTGLMDGMEGNIYVKLSINGRDYTTNGEAADGTNEYHTCVVTPGGEMSSM
jgi:hypothetical protein